MSKSGGVSGFFDFLRGKRSALVCAALLLVGAILLMSGSLGEGDGDTDSLSDEERLAALCSSIEGVGECRVYITYAPSGYGSDEGRVESVAIVCRGASSTGVRAELISVISSLYGIGTNRISISKMTS